MSGTNEYHLMWIEKLNAVPLPATHSYSINMQWLLFKMWLNVTHTFAPPAHAHVILRRWRRRQTCAHSLLYVMELHFVHTNASLYSNGILHSCMYCHRRPSYTFSGSRYLGSMLVEGFRPKSVVRNFPYFAVHMPLLSAQVLIQIKNNAEYLSLAKFVWISNMWLLLKEVDHFSQQQLIHQIKYVNVKSIGFNGDPQHANLMLAITSSLEWEWYRCILHETRKKYSVDHVLDCSNSEEVEVGESHDRIALRAQTNIARGHQNEAINSDVSFNLKIPFIFIGVAPLLSSSLSYADSGSGFYWHFFHCISHDLLETALFT